MFYWNFSRLNAETEWVGYLSDLICRSCRAARRTGGSNYIRDERSVGIHYSLRLDPRAKNQKSGPVIQLRSTEGSSCSHRRPFLPLTKPEESWFAEQMFLLTFKPNYFVEPRARTRRGLTGRQREETKAD